MSEYFLGDPPTDRGPIVGIPQNDLDALHALVAEAIEAAAKTADEYMEPHVAKAIRALTPADAQAAREARDKQAIKDATTSELAAELLRRWHPANVTQARYPDSVPLRAALRAIAEGEE